MYFKIFLIKIDLQNLKLFFLYFFKSISRNPFSPKIFVMGMQNLACIYHQDKKMRVGQKHQH